MTTAVVTHRSPQGSKDTKSPIMVDLFAGCGGLSLGLELAGFRPVAFCEVNPDASSTYLANRDAGELDAFRDVRTMDTSCLRDLKRRLSGLGFREVDLVCGGPPCQGYSGIGHRRSYAVAREEIPSNHLYKEMIRVVETITPRLFLFENVRGLLTGRWTATGRRGEIWHDVYSAFSAIKGYRVSAELVQAKQYAVPQNRPRILLVGVRDDVDWDPEEGKVAKGLLPEPGPTLPPNLIDLLGDLDDPDYREKQETTTYPSAPKCQVQRELRTTRGGELLGKGDRLTEQVYSRHSPHVLEKFEHMHQHAGAIPEHLRTKKFAQRLLPARWGKEGPNITATSLADDFVHYSRPRTLTVREWARLQTFPDWYKFEGKRTTGGTRRAGVPTEGNWDREVPKYTQIGNAVPVKLAQAVGTHFVERLLG